VEITGGTTEVPAKADAQRFMGEPALVGFHAAYRNDRNDASCPHGIR
jgi:hypothetical protein